MLELARDIIGTQPILALFLAIGVGYLVGQINIGGFSLGVGAVLFVGLAIGAFAPKAQITGPIGLTGLIMFLYGIGILYGRQFFEGMTGAAGRKYNLLAFVAVRRRARGRTWVWAKSSGSRSGHTLGIYAGSMTSTATLQAALDVMHNSEPSIGYSIAYPFGVIGPILCIYFMTRRVQPKFPPKAQRFHMGEVTLGDNCAGRTLDELSKDLPSGVQVTMVRKGGQNIVPSTDMRPGIRRRSHDRRRTARTQSPKRPHVWEGWSPAVSSKIVLPSTTSGFSSGRPMWSACRSHSFRCRPAFRFISCMSAAMTWTSSRPPI